MTSSPAIGSARGGSVVVPDRLRRLFGHPLSDSFPRKSAPRSLVGLTHFGQRPTFRGYVASKLTEFRASRVIYNNHASIRQCSDGMAAVGGHNRHDARLRSLTTPVDRHF